MAVELPIGDRMLRGSKDWLFEAIEGEICYKETVVQDWKGHEILRTSNLDSIEEIILNSLLIISRRHSSVRKVRMDKCGKISDVGKMMANEKEMNTGETNWKDNSGTIDSKVDNQG